MDETRAIKTLEMLRELMLFDPTTGEDICVELLNRDNRDLYEAAQVAIDALNEQVGRQKGCAWCEDRVPDNFECALLDDDGNTVVTEWNDAIWTTATYCPVCGRKLEIEHE